MNNNYTIIRNFRQVTILEFNAEINNPLWTTAPVYVCKKIPHDSRFETIIDYPIWLIDTSVFPSCPPKILNSLVINIAPQVNEGVEDYVIRHKDEFTLTDKIFTSFEYEETLKDKGYQPYVTLNDSNSFEFNDNLAKYNPSFIFKDIK